MRVAVLYSGGKDSNYALYKASLNHKIECLITLDSQNEHSYMFQKPGNQWIELQAQCLEIPLIRYKTKGEKETELKDLKNAISQGIHEYGIQGLVTGAIQSVYQASRIQKICYELAIYCFNPLWQIDEEKFLNELINNNFEIKIIAIASYPLGKESLGVSIDSETRDWLLTLHKHSSSHKHYSLSPIGEGGEFESFVLDSPNFKKKIEITKSNTIMDGKHSGILKIENAQIIEK